MEDLPQRFSVNLMRLHRDRCLNRNEAEFTQVSEEDSDHAERKIDVGSDIYHCRWYLRELQHREVLGAEPAWLGDPGPGRGHRGDQVEGLAGVPRAAPGQGVRPDHPARLLVEPPVIVRRHERLSSGVGYKAERVRMLTCRWSPVRWTRTAISYATWPMSASLVVRTARQAPWPAADTMKNPDVISIID